MTDTASKKIVKIETSAILADGRIITSSRSFPKGITREEYRNIDRENITAFGSEGTRTVGTFADDGGIVSAFTEQSITT